MVKPHHLNVYILFLGTKLHIYKVLDYVFAGDVCKTISIGL
jgi:hypothetical protein